MLREQVVSPDVLFAQSRFARSMKSFRLRIENKSFSTSSTGELRESSQVPRFFCDRSNDESNKNKQAKKVCEYSSF